VAVIMRRLAGDGAEGETDTPPAATVRRAAREALQRDPMEQLQRGGSVGAEDHPHPRPVVAGVDAGEEDVPGVPGDRGRVRRAHRGDTAGADGEGAALPIGDTVAVDLDGAHRGATRPSLVLGTLRERGGSP